MNLEPKKRGRPKGTRRGHKTRPLTVMIAIPDIIANGGIETCRLKIKTYLKECASR